MEDILDVLKKHLKDSEFIAACKSDIKAVIDSIVERSREELVVIYSFDDEISKELDDYDGSAVDYLLGFVPDDDIDSLGAWEILSSLSDGKWGELVSDAGWDDELSTYSERHAPLTEEELKEKLEEWRRDDYIRNLKYERDVTSSYY